MKRLLVFLLMAVVILEAALFLITNPTALSSSNADVKKELKGPQFVKVNDYDLAGGGIKIRFSMKDPKAPELAYGSERGDKLSRKVELKKLDLGFLASTTLQQIPD